MGDWPEATLMRAMVQAFAAYERALIRARTSAAMYEHMIRRCQGSISRVGKEWYRSIYWI